MKNASQDQAIIKGIQAGGAAANTSLRQLYQDQREKALAFLQKNGASEAVAKDVFQDAVIAVYQNIQTGKFRGESSLSGYLFSVGRFLWLNRIKRQGIAERVIDQLDLPEIESSHLPRLLAEEEANRVQQLFGQIGTDCQEVLSKSIYFDYSMEELAVHMQYANAQIARNKKYRCLTRLRKWLNGQPAAIQWLKELRQTP